MTNLPPLLFWLLGTLLPLGSLWLLFRLLLRRERCYGYNRLLLLLAPVLAAGLPLLPPLVLPAWLAPAVEGVALPAVLLPAMPAGPVAAPAGWPWQSWPWQSWLLGLYALGVAGGLARLAWQLGRLWHAGRRLPRVAQAGYTLVQTAGKLPTSSFGRLIFWDESAALAPAEARAVLAHELAHVRQGHTYDLLWLTVWRAVLWPNPFAHLLLPALRLTHELLADAAAAQAGAATGEAAAYPVMLARLAVQRLAGPGYLALVQPFMFSSTLTRIAMLQNQIPVRRWKQWLALPVLGGLFVVACRTTDVRPASAPSTITSAPFLRGDKEAVRQAFRQVRQADSLQNGANHMLNSTERWEMKEVVGQPGMFTITISHEKQNQLLAGTIPASDGKPKIYTYVEQMPHLPGHPGTAAVVEAIQANVVYPTDPNGKRLPEGRAYVSFTVNPDGTVGDIKVVKSAGPACDVAVIDAIQKLPRFEPGRQDGQAVAVSFTVPVIFKP